MIKVGGYPMKKTIVKELKARVADLGDLCDVATGTFTLAVSTSDQRHRAEVHFFRGTSFNQAWDQVATLMASTPNTAWVRIDVPQAIQKIELSRLQQQLKKLFRMNYWRRGISFDSDFKTALLEMEINGHEFIRPGKGHKIGKTASNSYLDFPAMTKYLTRRNGEQPQDLAESSFVWTFLTAGIFYDGDKIRKLSQDVHGQGIRQLTDLNTELRTTITAGEAFLCRQIKDSGQFIYGYYPARQRILSSYNSVRHFSSLYALLEAINFTGRTADLPKVKSALQWGIKNLVLTKGDAIFVSEPRKDGSIELKLGGQAMLMLALCKYQEVTQDDEYLPIIQQAFAGITSFLKPSGQFNHVLNADLTVKDAFRIIYYEGEITFAMARYYELVPNDQVAQLMQQTLDFMVAHHYGKYHDHWLSYAINEALQIFPANRDYMQMGLENVYNQLTFIEERDTSYPTLLELLDAAIKMTDLIKRTGNDDLLAPYDLGRLHRAWRYRASYELETGSFQPELAMYFYHPSKFVGGFFARHDHFRTRIDDCEHFLSGLINYYSYTNQGVSL